MAEVVDCYKTLMRGLLDITDNCGRRQASCRPRTWCGATTTIPIWWSPPTRAPRPSPTSPTACRATTASGSTTPSPRAARPATTTRGWASPRAAPGNASSGISASSASTSRPGLHLRRRRRHVGRRVRQRHAAVAAHQAARRPSTTCTSSSIPTPIRRPAFAERQRLFDLPRSSWTDYNAALISAGGGIFERKAKSHQPVAGDARPLRHRRGDR